MATSNGAPEQNAAPSLSVLAQYVKDFSFENPNAPNSLRAQGQSPNIQVNVNVNARGLSENDVEVELKIEGRAGEGADTVFQFELVYAGAFRIENVPDDSKGAVALIECPRLLFPFARQIIADAVRNGGFPPLMLDPIDFAALYRQRVTAQAGSPTLS
ncbi:protein-export chaperone SecB [Terrihabitans sp. B22-R8]|uniref:protein-export chaperone SecB n=1 Tax=Terrihabitans sp. B22-R8 TaxID=3425128 RepID=UPI00403C61AC